ncbi:hypothetical protein TCAL_16547 [Tigriopus californicus]|uniref:Uncharacterized protein n=1 Tax=Tigriopus californicus TaxID=6832 RepID=A0A553NDN1_TIGCA|nr:hypothetical protein TCAL_16547 [Tigriopus californicus]
MINDINQVISECDLFQRFSSGQCREPYQSDTPSTRPFESVSADIFEYSSNYFLVYVDRMIFGDFLSCNWTYHATEGAHAITDAHQDRCVSRSNVEMVDIEARYGKPRAANGKNQAHNCHHFVVCVTNNEEKKSLSSEASTIKHFPYVGSGKKFVPPQVIRQLSTKGYDESHHEMRQCCHSRGMRQIHVEHFFKVFRLGDEK